MCYIVFISHSLHWCYIKIALQEYVMTLLIPCKLLEYNIIFPTIEKTGKSRVVLENRSQAIQWFRNVTSTT